jgi:DNA-binding transcriptional ArsR family regulator
MSSTPTRTRGRPQHPGGQSRSDTDPSELLGALVDEDCREILRVTSAQSLSAGEISNACEIPSSTAYRKIEQLTEAGLLSESIRICSSGSHESEYECVVSNVEIELGDDGLDLAVDGRHDSSRPAAAD